MGVYHAGYFWHLATHCIVRDSFAISFILQSIHSRLRGMELS